MSNIAGFASSIRVLTLGVFRNDDRVRAEIAKMSLFRCMTYGWCCLLIATLISGFYQYVFSSQVLSQLDPSSSQFLEMSKAVQSMLNIPLDDLVQRLEVVRLSSFACLLMSPFSSWFFLYLLAGALFFVGKLVSMSPSSDGAYEQMMKIVSVAQAPLLLSVIPVVGPFIGNLWSMWYIAKNIGELFQIHLFTRATIVVFCSFVLFSVWNSTLTTLAAAYRNKGSSLSAKNLSRIESPEMPSDTI